jgi:esterase/lipase superfamily enzyme
MDKDSPYDATIGYLWPGYSNHAKYLEARRNTALAAPKFREFLETVNGIASKIDVAAHSLGNRLVLEALKEKKAIKPLIENFLSVAPAVDEDSIYRGQIFYLSTKLCKNMYVFFSKRDDVLKWIFPLPELHEALGYEGDQNPTKLPENIQMIDCSAIVDGHDNYLLAKPVYAYVKKVASNQSPGPLAVQDVVIKTDGQTEIIRKR